MSDLTRDDVREILEELMKKTEPPNEWFRDGYRVVTVDEVERKEVQNVFSVNPPKGIETPLKGDATVFHKKTQKITQIEFEKLKLTQMKGE